MDAFAAQTLFTGHEMLCQRTVLTAAGKVVAVVDDDSVPSHAQRHDLEQIAPGAVLAPGLIDLQVNGGGGVLFNDSPALATLATLAAAHRRWGTTGLMPTLISDTGWKLGAARQSVQRALDQEMPGILGLHLEGPYLAPIRRGVHDEGYLTPPALSDMEQLAPLSGGALMVTLAPERVPGRFLAALARRGVRVCAGHTDADYAQTMTALENGLAGFTHLCNAMPPLGHRSPGAVGAALDHAGAWVGVIADGHHLHDAMLRLIWRVKGPDKMFLVSDSMPPAGGPAEDFQLYGTPIRVQGDRCVDAEGRLAGAALPLVGMVRHCVTRAGIPLADSLRMATATPAAFLGLEGRVGCIAPGAAADFVLLDDGLHPKAIISQGRLSAGPDLPAQGER